MANALQEQGAITTLDELSAAKGLIEEIRAILEGQKVQLKAHGMTLPPLVLTTLKTVQRDLRKLESNLVDEQTELEQLRALAHMSAQITTHLEIDQALEETMDIVIALTRAERGYLILIDPNTGEYRYRIQRDSTRAPGTASQTPEISKSIISDVLANGEALLTDNAYKDTRLENHASIANFSLRSVLCVPLNYKRERFGVVYVDNRLQAGIFTEREKSTLTAFANTAAVAIANARYYTHVQQLLQEITQIKELIDNVFLSIGSGVIAAEESDTITIFNQAAENILEIAAESSIGQPLQLVMPKIASDLGEQLSSIRETQASAIFDAELTTKNRGRVALSMKLSPLQDASEQTRGVAVVVDDVTEVRQREQELRVMKTYLPPEMVDNIQTISQLALGGERRQVTCLFAEVRPLSTLKDVPPGEIMDILNVFLSLATACIHETQGIVDKYMGNEVMAMWNTQLSPTDDHAARAIDCALLMRERFLALYDELGITPEPHYYRIGMHTGVATLGNVGSINRRDFTAIGDTINLSKRLEENARYGQIIVSETTRAELDGAEAHLHFTELAPIKVKGRQQEARIFEVTRHND